jgi:catechol 2,3-dioxygenase-like lactoylglutathione lyase family enzyme
LRPFQGKKADRMSEPSVVQVTGLDHFVLRVHDLEHSLSFYRGVLGLPIEFLEEYRAGSRPFVSARIGAQLLDLVPDPTYNPEDGWRTGGFLHLCVRVAGRLLDVLPRLRERGIELIEEEPVLRMGATGWGQSVYVRDPDGYVVELKEEAK